MTGIDTQQWERAIREALPKAIACARTQWLQDLLHQHLPEIATLSDTPTNHAIARQWDAKIKSLMEARGLTTPSQQKNRLVDIRNALKTLDPNHPALADVGFTPAQWEEINRASEDKVGDRSTKFLNDPDVIVNKAIELLNSREWNEVAAGLAVLTGRRCTEILKTASFEEKTPYSVIFTGALKRQDEPVALQFEIPTLAPAHEVIKAIALLREWVDTSGMDNREVNNRYAQGVIKACARHFRDLVPTRDGEDNLYTHLFRAVYATIATHWYCPPNVPPLEFRAYIQGHFKILDEQDPTLRRSLAAQRNYFDYQIGDGKGNVDGRLGIKLGESGVAVIEEFQRYYQPVNKVTTASAPQDGRGNRSESQSSESQQLSLLPHKGDRSSFLSGVKDAAFCAITSDCPWEVLTGLMASTGRMTSELLKSRIFEADKSNSFSLLFSSTVAKDKQKIPTLIEASVILEAIARLKKHPDVQPLLYLSPTQIEQECLPQIEKIIGERFLFKDLTEMREAYSALSDESVVVKSHKSKPHTVIYNIHPDDKERLNEIATQFHTSTQAATATLALDWAEAALLLADRLGFDSPEALNNWVSQQFSPQSLSEQQVEVETKSKTPSEKRRDRIAPGLQNNEIDSQPTNEPLLQKVLEGFDKQQQSLATLTQSIQSLVTTLAGQSQPMTTLTSERQTSKGASAPPSQHEPSSPLERSSSRSSSAQEKINAAIDAIMHHNNTVATTKKDKWAISISALKELTKCFQGAISRVMEARREEIEAHHAAHSVGKFQNSKGKFAPHISQIITLCS